MRQTRSYVQDGKLTLMAIAACDVRLQLHLSKNEEFAIPPNQIFCNIAKNSHSQLFSDLTNGGVWQHCKLTGSFAQQNTQKSLADSVSKFKVKKKYT